MVLHTSKSHLLTWCRLDVLGQATKHYQRHREDLKWNVKSVKDQQVLLFCIQIHCNNHAWNIMSTVRSFLNISQNMESLFLGVDTVIVCETLLADVPRFSGLITKHWQSLGSMYRMWDWSSNWSDHQMSQQFSSVVSDWNHYNNSLMYLPEKSCSGTLCWQHH